jgi:uncharacterized protein (UPF0262 family)
MTLPQDARLARVVLGSGALTRLSPILEADRAQAVADLASGSRFAPLAANPGAAKPGTVKPGTPHPGPPAPGPYELHLSVWEGRLVFDVRHIDGAKVLLLGLALGPFRGLIKDYQLLVESHAKAVEEGRESRIQAIDMGRRGLHNEGAALLCQRLDGKIAIDFETARRLFTLVCVLHTRVQG